jgi:hypothetical protein
VIAKRKGRRRKAGLKKRGANVRAESRQPMSPALSFALPNAYFDVLGFRDPRGYLYLNPLPPDADTRVRWCDRAGDGLPASIGSFG